MRDEGIPTRGAFHSEGRPFLSGVGYRVSGIGYRVSGVGYRVSGIGYRVSGVGYRVSGVGCRVSGVGYRVSGVGYRVSGVGYRVSGVGYRVSGVECRVSGHARGTPLFLLGETAHSLYIRRIAKMRVYKKRPIGFRERPSKDYKGILYIHALRRSVCPRN